MESHEFVEISRGNIPCGRVRFDSSRTDELRATFFPPENGRGLIFHWDVGERADCSVRSSRFYSPVRFALLYGVKKKRGRKKYKMERFTWYATGRAVFLTPDAKIPWHYSDNIPACLRLVVGWTVLLHIDYERLEKVFGRLASII